MAQSRRDFLRMSGLATAGGLLVAGGAVRPAFGAEADSVDRAWHYADGIRGGVVRFADRTFAVTDYGAVGDGTTLDSAAFRDAIAACSAAGGGHVVVPAGRFLTGAIHLLSNVDLHLEDGATVAFSTDPADFLPVVYSRYQGVECYNYSPFIYAYGQHNIAITGSGTLDGQADSEHWYPWLHESDDDWASLQQMANTGVPVSERVFGAGHFFRPSLIQPYRCRNVVIEGVTLIRSPMWTVNPVLSQQVTIRDVTVQTDGPNTDGCDPESCSQVIITGCTFSAGDDCIALKSGRDADGRRVNTPCEDILIQDCTMQLKYGAVAIGSEASGGIRNVFVRNCTMGNPGLYYALYVKTNSVRGGFVENVYFKDSQISELNHEAITINLNHGEGDTGSFDPVVRNISISGLRSAKSRNAILLVGYPDDPISDVRLQDCVFDNVAGDNTLQYVRHLVTRGVSINGAAVDLTGNY
jgi:polygalacturonase